MARKRRRTEEARRTNRAGLAALSLLLTKQLAPAAEGDGAAAAAAAGANANLAFSPASIYAALALLAAGARCGTLQEHVDALGRGSATPPPRPTTPRHAPSTSPTSVSETAAGDELPKYSLCIFLPDERDGLAGLVEKLASGPGFWHYRLPATPVPVGEFRLPKFKLSVSGSVRQALRDGMGINAAFVAGDADLSDMAERDGGGNDGTGTTLHVGDVCHKAVLEVNEEGGKASMVATGSYMLCGASAVMDQPETVDFVADHPFVFFVIDEVSRAIVLVGRVLDPSV